jgi:Mrp family chromosome partitioning ATPase/predicted Fe-Mo cluster-binding NifX family protein
MSDSEKGASSSSKQDKATSEQDKLIEGALGIIKHKLLVMSGKGGVGKSSVAANLAIALSKSGAKVGLMDVDLHGPDIPRMLGLKGLLDVSADRRLVPKEYSKNLKVVSIESLTQDQDEAVIWRGPLKMHVIRQFLSDVHWESLDYLIIDCPPGTGDEPLSIAQTIPGTKAVIVTLPQEVSLGDVRKSISFCRTVKMPIVGLIENMSGFMCPHCNKSVELFGAGGGFRTAMDMSVPFLGSIPFDPRMVKCGDSGESYMDKYPDSDVTKAFDQVVQKIKEGSQVKAPVPESKSTEQAEQTDEKDATAMKIAIPIDEGRLTAHFGHASEFAIVQVENREIKKSISYPPPAHEPGVLPAWLHELGVSVIIAGGMGQKALSLFGQNGIKVVTGAPGLAPEELVQQYLSDTLVAGENVCDH